MSRQKVLCGDKWSAKMGDMQWLMATILSLALLLPCQARPQA